MTGPRHLPLIAWSRQDLINARSEHQSALDAIDKESRRRGDRDEKRHGFPITMQEKPGYYWTGYRHFATAAEAYDAAVLAFPEDKESAPYKVIPIYLGKDDAS